MDASTDVRRLVPRLIAGDIGPALASFDGRATVDSPIDGKQQPQEWVAGTRAWLDAHHARYTEGRTTASDGRVAHECTLTLEVVDTAEAEGVRTGYRELRELPMLLIAEIREEGIHALRVYHSTWPVNHEHLHRTALIEPDYQALPPEPVGAYFAAMAVGDVDAIQELFEADGYVREPSGDEYKHVGAAREQFYRPLRARGGVGFQVVTCTDDGSAIAVEYICDEWAGVKTEPQPGASVWERSLAGKIAAVRIYEDITPPSFITGA